MRKHVFNVMYCVGRGNWIYLGTFKGAYMQDMRERAYRVVSPALSASAADNCIVERLHKGKTIYRYPTGSICVERID